MREKRLAATAYHEAGHTVAAWALGIKVGAVTIMPTKEYDGQAAHGRILKKRDLENLEFGGIASFGGEAAALQHAVVAFAGIVAQRKFSPSSVRSHHGSSDRRSVAIIAERVCGDDRDELRAWCRRAERRAERIIEHSWLAVKALADRLIEVRSLSGADALEAIQSAYTLPDSERARLAALFPEH